MIGRGFGEFSDLRFQVGRLFPGVLQAVPRRVRAYGRSRSATPGRLRPLPAASSAAQTLVDRSADRVRSRPAASSCGPTVAVFCRPPHFCVRKLVNGQPYQVEVVAMFSALPQSAPSHPRSPASAAASASGAAVRGKIAHVAGRPPCRLRVDPPAASTSAGAFQPGGSPRRWACGPAPSTWTPSARKDDISGRFYASPARRLSLAASWASTAIVAQSRRAS